MIRRRALLTILIASGAALAPVGAVWIAWAMGASRVAIIAWPALIIVAAVALSALLIGRLWSPVACTLEASAQAATRDREHLAGAHERLSRLGAILDSLNEPVLVIDRSHHIVFANSSAAEFFQTDVNRLIGSPALQTITQTSLLSLVEQGLKGQRESARIDLPTQRGQRIYEALIAPIPDQDDGATLILRDVTELARAARMKTDFVANASHELRTPIASIKAALETARDARDEPDTLLRFIDMIPAHLRRLEEMTGDLIDLSRLENPNLSIRSAPLALADLTDALASLSSERARERHVEVSFDFSTDLEGFNTDPSLVRLILKNLLDNALKFCDADSTVRVIGALEKNDTGAGGRSARFEVRDRGVGVPLNLQQRIFERFYQVDAAKLGLPGGRTPPRGTGLGLAIVKHAVVALGGEVGVDSVYQEGATVWLVIPELRG